MEGDGKHRHSLGFALLILLLALPACSSEKKAPNSSNRSTASPGIPTSTKIRVNWTANLEVDVNKAGGGYRVYYSSTPGVNTSSGTYVDVPYVSGPTAPTTALISGLTVGTYYIRVVGYSAYNPLGISGGRRSSDSAESSISIP